MTCLFIHVAIIILTSGCKDWRHGYNLWEEYELGHWTTIYLLSLHGCYSTLSLFWTTLFFCGCDFQTCTFCSFLFCFWFPCEDDQTENAIGVSSTAAALLPLQWVSSSLGFHFAASYFHWSLWTRFAKVIDLSALLILNWAQATDTKNSNGKVLVRLGYLGTLNYPFLRL